MRGSSQPLLPMNVSLCSGGFDPPHIGHLAYLEVASKLGDRLIVAINSDAWLIRKKGKVFMPWDERKRMLLAIRWVDEVMAVDDSDGTVAEAIRRIKPFVFANGGDRVSPVGAEWEACREVGAIMAFNVGGAKTQSSSALLKAYKEVST